MTLAEARTDVARQLSELSALHGCDVRLTGRVRTGLQAERYDDGLTIALETDLDLAYAIDPTVSIGMVHIPVRLDAAELLTALATNDGSWGMALRTDALKKRNGKH